MNDLLTAVLAVLTAIGQWVGGAFSDWVFPIFWNTADGGSLTILGVLAIMGFGIGLIFLLIGVVQNFFSMRS